MSAHWLTVSRWRRQDGDAERGMAQEIGIAADLRSQGRGLILSHALERRPVR